MLPTRWLKASHPMQLVLGLCVWSVWFVALYGGMSVACALAPPAQEVGAVNWLNGSLALLTLATAAVLGYAAFRCWRSAAVSAPTELDKHAPQRPTRFITRIAAGLHCFSAAATLAVGLPLLLLPPCV